MPKVKKVGKFRAKAASLSSPLVAAISASSKKTKKDTPDETSDAKSAPRSRGQRKRLAKKEQYLKRDKMIMSSLHLKQMEDQQKRIDGLRALRDALPCHGSSSSMETTNKTAAVPPPATNDPTKSSTTNKAKTVAANKEMVQMSLVLQHPSFRENPFSAVQEHLRNTLKTQGEQQKKLSERKRLDDETRLETKKHQQKLKRQMLKASKKKMGVGRAFKSRKVKR